ncbi:uncharacterized protein LOC124260492 [Haliotis rubra]|uniref:uncharacterized protein LOC124260492 n=1 Tax=Haliotis rubra TaxID=36100 RepID=UPI001EE5F00C|nr:uncharacterized protein LOC124260492 [Haliotis rubra]
MASKTAFIVLAVSTLCVAGVLLVYFTALKSPDVSVDVHARAAATTIKAATTTPKPVVCYHCTDLSCYTSPVSSNCVGNNTYCISEVTDHSNGNRDIIKGCASLTQCQQSYSATRAQPRCLGIDHQVSGYAITCSFCCKGDNCNRGPHLTPTEGVPFVGKAIVG